MDEVSLIFGGDNPKAFNRSIAYLAGKRKINKI